MKKALIGAAALASMLPHATMAAQDGQPGATSQESFNVTLTVNPPGGDAVTIEGLRDATRIWPDAAGPEQDPSNIAHVYVEKMPVCLNVTQSGNAVHNVPVTLTVSQSNYTSPSEPPSAFPGAPSGLNFSMTSGSHTLPMEVRYMTSDFEIGQGTILAPGAAVTVQSSQLGCDGSLFSFSGSNATGGIRLFVYKHRSVVANTGPYVAVMHLTVAVN
ncbi:MAG: hypothetical protein IPN84_08470 [Sphingomonadales bacterium]|nr:hypothetical protein [Sphingomonadales bacterium]